MLRRVLGFARATGIAQPGFDPTEGLAAPTPDPAVARARRPTSKPRPLSLPECARIATHLHPVYQMVLWLQRVMGLRISEAFGRLVDDVIDHGDTGLLLVRGQGGRDFRIRDDDGRVITVPHKERTKTEAGTRVLVIPMIMLEMLRVVIEAFHTDPDTGDAEETSPGARPSRPGRERSSGLPPGIRESYDRRRAQQPRPRLPRLTAPAAQERRHRHRLAYRNRGHGAARFMGHRAADDVYGRVYTLDHPELTPLAEVARVLDDMIRDSIGTLLIPTTRDVTQGAVVPDLACIDVDLSRAADKTDGILDRDVEATLVQDARDDALQVTPIGRFPRGDHIAKIPSVPTSRSFARQRAGDGGDGGATTRNGARSSKATFAPSI